MAPKVHEYSPEEFLEMKDTWNNAVQRCLDNHVFLTWEWLSTWWKHFGGNRKFLLLTLSDSGRVLASAPLMSTVYSLFGARVRKIEFLGTPASDYQTFLLTERKTENVELLLGYAQRRVPDWHFVELTDVPERCETSQILGSMRLAPLGFEHEVMEACPYVSLPEDFDDFQRTLSPHFLNEIRRRERRLGEEFGVEFEVVERSEHAEDAVRSLAILHQKRSVVKGHMGIFSDERVMGFHLDIARSFAKNGWLLVAFLKVNGRRVSGQYNFIYANKLYCYLSGFDPVYAKYGLGSIIDFRLIEHCINAGIKEYDFARGQEPYKNRWNPRLRDNLRFTKIRKGLFPRLMKWAAKNHLCFGKVARFARVE
jgi:CelD/BcsL family acetyltransferase involved in cellulose biosynthesis